jgi:hypothetical protein
MKTHITKVTNRLLNYVEAADHAGYDPYDALNSPVLRALSVKNKWARIALIENQSSYN